MLSHYRIESWLGEGAMGVVYLARDTHLDRSVAIKVLRPESTLHPERRKRFVQEAKAASALNHPNIITIYDISAARLDGDADAALMDFIAMEYIEGDTLAHMVGRQGLAWGEALKYAIQMADALAAAHNAGLVHRDLKPANIMVTGPASAHPGLVKILDFGLAKLLETADAFSSEADAASPTETVDVERGPRTERGTIIGTVAYMSPEQAEGKPVDARSDIFSYGSVLYEMLTGKWAFQGESKLAILSAILHAEPQPITTLIEGLPPEIEQIIGRCLRKDPERRFQHMGDVKVALAELRETSDSGRMTLTAVAPRAAAEKPRRLGSKVAVTAVAAILAVAGAWLTWSRAAGWLRLGSVPAEKQLAVLPFENIGGDPANQAFCDGLGETLASTLTQLEQFQTALRVIPTREVRREKLTGVRQARQAFGVSLVVTGSVQRAGGEVRLTANLVDARTLGQLRSQTIKVPIEELSSLQDRTVREVVNMLELELGPQARLTVNAGGTTVPGAYDFYVQGRGYLQYYDRPENLESAIELFQRALEKDPQYALAHAALGEAYWQKYRLVGHPHWVDLAHKSCGQAVKLNERLAPAHITLGALYRGAGQHEKAVAELHAALRSDQLNSDAHRELAATYEAMGKMDDAEATFKKAIQLKPGYWAGYNDLGAFYHRRGRYAEAETQFLTITKLVPDSPRAYASLGGIYHMLGRYDEAIAMLNKSLAIKPTAQAYTNLGTLYSFQGRYAEAVPMMENAVKLNPNNHQFWGNLAEAYLRTPTLASKAPETYRRAVQLAEQARSVNPKDAVVRARLASYLAKLGEKDAALTEIEEARRLAPDNVTVLFRAASVYEITGHRNRALKALEAAIDNGYSIEEIHRAADLAELRKDPRYLPLEQGRHSP